MPRDNVATFYPKNREEWRQWLHENHASEQSVWLLCYKLKTGIPTINWSDAVDEALCFGWIDSTRVSLDGDSFQQFFCRRKPKSNWSKINKEKVRRLIEDGQMMPAGFTSIEIAKQNGSWTILDSVEELILPEDFIEQLSNRPGSEEFFQSLSKSVRKSILYRINQAKRMETRKKRIYEIVEILGQKQKPRQF